MTDRSRRRDEFTEAQRLSLAEQDLDAHEEKIGRMIGIMLGILISTTTAAIMLAITLGVGR